MKNRLQQHFATLLIASMLSATLLAHDQTSSNRGRKRSNRTGPSPSSQNSGSKGSGDKPDKGGGSSVGTKSDRSSWQKEISDAKKQTNKHKTVVTETATTERNKSGQRRFRRSYDADKGRASKTAFNERPPQRVGRPGNPVRSERSGKPKAELPTRPRWVEAKRPRRIWRPVI